MEAIEVHGRREPLRLVFKGRTTSETNHKSQRLLECWICLGEVKKQIQTSIFEEPSFLALLLMAWQKTLP